MSLLTLLGEGCKDEPLAGYDRSGSKDFVDVSSHHVVVEGLQYTLMANLALVLNGQSNMHMLLSSDLGVIYSRRSQGE